jgi:hypothetical protein
MWGGGRPLLVDTLFTLGYKGAMKHIIALLDDYLDKTRLGRGYVAIPTGGMIYRDDVVRIRDALKFVDEEAYGWFADYLQPGYAEKKARLAAEAEEDRPYFRIDP